MRYLQSTLDCQDLPDYELGTCMPMKSKKLFLHSFLLIHEQRKDYFWETQKKVPSTRVLDPSSLPAKNESLHGIVWLPRIIQKARAKLLGELDPTTMYCCGGDRYFFQTNQIHPAEFLRVVKRADNDDSSIVQWVLNRKNETE